VDGLLLTKRERLRLYGEKMGLVVGPSAAFALVLLALGVWVDAVFVAAVAGMTALSVGSAVRTRTGAAIFGFVVAGGIFLFVFFFSLVATHPILSGS
jgi:hypothetical protein